ncbi:MAG: hypothetical protein J6J35_02505 [Alphaproteobacteria bacterium]|nr:hypothetical protein [Alphaproteobacteria bacterium]
MNIFRKIFKKKSSVQTEEQALQVEDEQKIRVLLEMENCVLCPIDLLEPLSIAVVMDSKKAFMISVDKIKLYAMYDAEEDTFLGSFYAVKRNGKYYGNIVGSWQIVSCRPTAFRFVKTDEVVAPLRNDEKSVFALVCRYVQKSGELMVERLEKKDISTQNAEILHHFDTGTTFSTAFCFWEKEFLKK